MKVYNYSVKPYDREYFEKLNNQRHELVFDKDRLTVETAIKANGFDAVTLFTADDASGDVLEVLASVGVKYIVLRSAGHDHIDLAKSKDLMIKVAYVPNYSPNSIAEHTITMILAMNRHIIEANDRIKQNNFSLQGLTGFDLNGKTVGIIGAGRIGVITASILSAFGCKILAYDIVKNNDLEKLPNASFIDLDTLFYQSDIISLHCPLNIYTKYLINAQSISKMKKGVMIVNTGRGGLINTTDAITAIKNGSIGYLGLDVFEREKTLFFEDHSSEILQDDEFARLKTLKNVLITGHQAFLTSNALENIIGTTLKNLDSLQLGGDGAEPLA